MRKAFLFMLATLTLFMLSCSNEVDGDNCNVGLTLEMFDQLKEISAYHSKGLDSCFDHYNDVLNSCETPDYSIKAIKKLSMDFVVENGDIESVHFTRSSDNAVLDENQMHELSVGGETILEEYFTLLLQSSSPESAEFGVKSIMQSESFSLLNEDEQSYLLFMMLIGIDSAKYWSDSENYEKWQRIGKLEPTVDTKSPAGPPASSWISSEQMSDPTFLRILQADVRGCGWSLLTGFAPWSWAAGGIAGSVDSALF